MVVYWISLLTDIWLQKDDFSGSDQTLQSQKLLYKLIMIIIIIFNSSKSKCQGEEALKCKEEIIN